MHVFSEIHLDFCKKTGAEQQGYNTFPNVPIIVLSFCELLTDHEDLYLSGTKFINSMVFSKSSLSCFFIPSNTKFSNLPIFLLSGKIQYQ